MKIRIISPFFFPEPISSGKYNTHLARHLSKLGNTIHVVCFHPFYPKWIMQPSSEMIEGISINRGGAFLHFPQSQIVRRLLLELAFCIHVLMDGSRRNDIDIYILPPSFFALLSSSFILSRAKKNVAIIHDLQGVYLEKRSGVLSNLITKMVCAIEKRTLNQQSKIIFLSCEMRDKAISDYNLDPNCCHVHYPFSTYEPNLDEKESLTKIFPNEILHVTYSGALGEKQNPKGLIELMGRICQDFRNIQCHIFSAGPSFQSLKLNNANDGIKFHDLVSEEDLTELYARSTMQIVPQFPGTSTGSMPSKLPNIARSGCHFLVITDKNSELESVCKNIPNCLISTTWEYGVIRSIIAPHLLSTTDSPRAPQNDLFPILPLIDEILSV